MLTTKVWPGIVRIFAVSLLAVSSLYSQNQYLTFGIFLGKIEEGARIFTPVRFLPRNHPGARGHDFPTVMVFHESEFRLLLQLGDSIGVKLWPTLERYPQEPIAQWNYTGYLPPPIDSLHGARIYRYPGSITTVPGLKIVAFVHRFPIAFIVDTRSLSLAERSMERSTAMGLDMTRDQFIGKLTQLAAYVPEEEYCILKFD